MALFACKRLDVASCRQPGHWISWTAPSTAARMSVRLTLDLLLCSLPGEIRLSLLEEGSRTFGCVLRPSTDHP